MWFSILLAEPSVDNRRERMGQMRFEFLTAEPELVDIFNLVLHDLTRLMARRKSSDMEVMGLPIQLLGVFGAVKEINCTIVFRASQGAQDLLSQPSNNRPRSFTTCTLGGSSGVRLMSFTVVNTRHFGQTLRRSDR